MIRKFGPYKKDLLFSYCVGAFPSIELLTQRPQEVLEVIFSSDGEANEGLGKIKKMANSLGIKASLDNHLVEEVSGKQNAYVVTRFNKFDSPAQPDKPHLVLLHPSDAGNLGTIMRTALAFNIKDLVIIKPAVDYFDPKVVRASMGAIFQINISTFDSFEAYQEKFPRDFFIFTPDGETELSATIFSEPAGLVFGTESAGVPNEIKDKGKTVRVKQSDKVDSLNLPISVGIALYNFSLKTNSPNR